MVGIGIGTHPDARWRYVSTLWPRDISPIYFSTRASVERYDRQTQQAIGCLPGMTTMRIEQLDEHGQWVPADGGAGDE